MSTNPASAVDHKLGERAAAGVKGEMIAAARIEPTRRHYPSVVAVEVALLRSRNRRLIPRMPLIDRIAERIVLDEYFAAVPIVVERRAEQDANAEIDVHQVVRDGLAVHDNAGRDVHRLAPLVHFLVGVIAHFRVVRRTPTSQENAALADLLVTGQRLVEEIEQIVVSGTTFFMNSTYFIKRTM